MAYKDLRDYLAALEIRGKLHHVKKEVDPDWEVAAVIRRWNSLEDAADDGRNLPVRINFLFHVVEFAPDFQSGQIVAEVLVGQVASPPAGKLRDYSTDARTRRQRPCGAALGQSTLAGLAAPTIGATKT